MPDAGIIPKPCPGEGDKKKGVYRLTIIMMEWQDEEHDNLRSVLGRTFRAVGIGGRAAIGPVASSSGEPIYSRSGTLHMDGPKSA